MPRFDPATWRLRVDGLVGSPRSFNYEELRALPRAEQVSTFHCVTGWSVQNVHWAGVRLSTLLDTVEAQPAGRVLSFVSAEKPYVDTLTRRAGEARRRDARLRDGRPAAEPGRTARPLRLVIPEMYGYKNVKWVERITLGRSAEPGYWEQRGYDTDAWVGGSNGL